MAQRFPKVVIVGYADHEAILRCAHSVRSASQGKASITVFDNSPTPVSRKSVHEALPEWIKYETAEKNLGYAGCLAEVLPKAFNQGAESVLFLNQDLVVEPQFFDRLLSVVQKGVAVVGPSVYDIRDPTKLMYTGGKVVWPWGHVRLEKTLTSDALTYVNGSAFLVTREGYEGVGNVDHEYFLYFEETDYCYRAALKGLKAVPSPAKVFHEPGNRPVHYAYWMTRNRILFFRKHGKPSQIIGVAGYTLTYWLATVLWKYKRTPVQAFIAFARGVWWNVRDIRNRGLFL